MTLKSPATSNFIGFIFCVQSFGHSYYWWTLVCDDAGGRQRGGSVHLVGPAASPRGQQVEQTLFRVMLQKSELMFEAPVIVCV